MGIGIKEAKADEFVVLVDTESAKGLVREGGLARFDKVCNQGHETSLVYDNEMGREGLHFRSFFAILKGVPKNNPERLHV